MPQVSSKSKPSSKPPVPPAKTPAKQSASSQPKPQDKAGVKSKPKPTADPKPMAPEGRPIIYSEVKAAVVRWDQAKAKLALGWEEEPVGANWEGFLFRDRSGKLNAETGVRGPGRKIRCHHNNHNRPFYVSLAEQWMYEILQRNWKLNGESMVFGETGLCLDTQHRLIGFVWACQEYANDLEEAAQGAARKWTAWDEEPWIESIVATGIKEDRDTVNTINTGKPRGFDDAIFASGVFGHLDQQSAKPADRKKIRDLSRMLASCIKLLCLRTGADVGAFAPRRTHAEGMDFLDRHKRALDAVKHIHEEDGEKGRISHYLSPGYAAAMLYLMGTSDTERHNEAGKGYSDVWDLGGRPSEDQLSFKLWDKAEAFWTELAKTRNPGKDRVGGPLRELVEALGDVKQYAEGGAHLADDLACVCRAWQQYVEGKPVKAEHFEFDYTGEGQAEILTPKGFLELEPEARAEMSLAETPTVSGDPDLGIDLGDPGE